MGNNNSNTTDYDLDTEIINMERSIEHKKIDESTNYDKLFITYSDNITIYGILIKVIDTKLYIYIKDISNNDIRLANIIVLSKYNNENLKKYIDYIHISKEYDIISIPEYDMINIYSLSNLINNKLKQIARTGLCVDNKNNELILKHTNNVISNNNNPYKCILCRDMYVLIFRVNDIYDKIIGINYENKNIYFIDNINIDSKTSILKISTMNNVIVLYDINKHCAYITNIIEEKFNNLSIDNNVKNNTLCVSDDGILLFYVLDIIDSKKVCFTIYNINNNKHYDIIIAINDIVDLSKLQFNLFNYDKFNDIDIINTYKIYILTGWDAENKKLYYWFIKYNDMNCILYRSKYFDMVINDEIKYNYTNRFIYIFKTVKGIVTYNLERILPIRVAEILRNDTLKKINDIYHNNKHNIIRYIDINCADGNMKRYELTNIMGFFINNNKNIYDIDYTVNIDIYNNNKSFDIFQKLLEGNKNIDNVIVDICNINGTTNRYNIMYDLLSHIYEFTKIIIIRPDMLCIEDDTNINNLKAYYIGYVLIIFILKFYTYCIKKNQKEYNYNKKDVRMDIIHIFNENFPPFNNFMNNIITSIL